MTLFRRCAAILLCSITLAACAPRLDSEQARICRSILPLLHRDGTVIDVASVGTMEVIRDHPFEGIRIDYLAKEPSRRHTAHYALCTFDPAGLMASERILRGIATDRGQIGETALFFMSRYYLADPETAAAIPGPGTTELARLTQFPEAAGPFLQHSLALLPLTGVYALLATSYALVYGLIGRINLAFGAFAAIGGVGGSLTLVALQSLARTEAAAALDPLLVFAVALLVAITLAACWGEALAALILAPLIRRGASGFATLSRTANLAGGQPILIATAGMLIAIPELLAIIQETRWLTPFLNTPEIVAVAGPLQITVTPISLIVFASSIALSLLVLVLMKRSRFGRAWRASADDPQTAALFGVSQLRILGATLTLSCGLAGFAGFAFCVQYGSIGYSDGRMLGIKALVAAIAGGIGSLRGAMLGGVLLGIAEAAWSATLPMENRDSAIFLVLVALLVLRPGGLLGFGDLAPRRV